ncbi:MAG: restriction endonuclease subunit S [Clostridiales bacterium]|nr:restriction endonuclease subunit S [Clostridiales bacterium]
MVTYPEDWEEKRLLDCVILVQGLTYTPENVKPYGTLVLRSSNIKEQRLSLNDNVYVNLSVSEEKQIQDGDILVCVRNGSAALIGKSCVLRRMPNTTFGAFMSVLRGDTTGFISKIFESDIVQSQVRDRSSATINQITKKDFEAIKIFVPTKSSEQKEIASTLSCFDSYIDDLAELIEKKKGIRNGALEDLMSGRTRLEGFDGEWVENSIDEITQTIITGGTPATAHPEYYGGKIPWLSSTEIHQKRVSKPTAYITEIGLQNSSAKIAPSKSVLIALAGQGKTRGTAAYLLESMALNQSLAALVTNEKCDSEFLFYLIESLYLYLRELSSGDGGRGGLNKKLIKNVAVKMPGDVAEQKAIAAILTAMDEEIEALETERDKMIQIREGAMDDLLTGRVRLTV